ncbi:MAG: hypothetical protein D6729_04830 [Deltaproteobacteria bacterium]|nr:MAG: hypothetical protein D6729_04830 [Deltaproteobacteria bacterium]
MTTADTTDVQATAPDAGAPADFEPGASLEVRLASLREGLAEADRRTRDFVREHPLLSLAGAVAAGYLVGRLFSRR